jgi:type I restriction enzyme S subunit
MSKAESANKVRSEVIDPPEPDDSTPVSWVWVRFGSIVDEIRNGISAAPAVEPPGRSILRISAVRTGSVDGQNVRYLRQEVPEWRTYLLREGDLLFTRYNGSLDLLGVCGLVRGLGDRELLYPDKLVRIRLDLGSVVPEYAELFFASPGARRRLTAGSVSSAGQQGISGATLKAQAFALPPKEEQKEIVRRTTELLDVSDQLLSHIDSAARATQTCAQVALAKAFEGDA